MPRPTKEELAEELALQQNLIDAIESAVLSLATDELRKWNLRASLFADQITPLVDCDDLKERVTATGRQLRELR
jgi:hypothetical protein